MSDLREVVDKTCASGDEMLEALIQAGMDMNANAIIAQIGPAPDHVVMAALLRAVRLLVDADISFKAQG